MGIPMRKFILSTLIIAGAVFAGAAAPAHAGLSLVTSVGALGANDSIDWGQLGPTFTVLSSPQSVTSAGGLGAVVSSAGGVFERRDEMNGWAGNIGAEGTALLWNQQVGPDITLTFAHPVFGAGAQIQADYYGGFTAQILASNGAVLGSFTENGTSDCCSNTAIFIGLLSTTANIASIEFTLTAAAYDTTSDFAIGPVALTTGVPELGTWAMMIIGFGGVALQLRRRTGAMAIAA